MTLSPCDQVAERVALGESLGDLTEHAATCQSCQRLVAVSSQLGQLGVMHHPVDPGLGFSARMTIGAQHRIAVRRRQRLATALVVTVVTGAFGVFLVTRTPDEPRVPLPVIANPNPPNPTPTPKDNAPTAADADLAALVQLADVDRSSRLSAKWTHIKKPLAPYKKLLKGVTP